MRLSLRFTDFGSRSCLFFILVISIGLSRCDSPLGDLDQKQCRDDELYLACGNSCAPDCSSIIDDLSTDSSTDCNNCAPGCFCKTGFYRDIDRRCVQPEYCTQQRPPRTGDIFRCPESSGDHGSTKLLCSASYYRCNNWVPKKLYCDGGQIFESKKRICRPVDQLPNCQFDCSDKEPKSMHSIGCSRYYWWCWNGLASKIACDANRYFNIDNNQCDFRENVADCLNKPDDVEKPEIPLIHDKFLVTLAFSCLCRDNGFYGEKCGKFYVECKNNEVQQYNGEDKQACPANTVFNPRWKAPHDICKNVDQMPDCTSSATPKPNTRFRDVL